MTGIAANPPPQSRLPDSLRNSDELRPYFTALQNDMYKLWLRTGGGTDAVGGDLSAILARLDIIEADIVVIEGQITVIQGEITAIEVRLDAIEADIIAITARLDAYQPRILTSVSTTVDYSASVGDWVEAFNRSTITLPAGAAVNDEVVITNGDSTTITVSSGVINIKYSSIVTSLKIKNEGTTLHFQLFTDGATNYWRVR